MPGAPTPDAAALAYMAAFISRPQAVATHISPDGHDAIVAVARGSRVLEIVACIKAEDDGWFAHGSTDGPGMSWHSAVVGRKLLGLPAPRPNVGASVLSVRAPEGFAGARVLVVGGETRLIPVQEGWAVAVEWNVSPDARDDALRFLGWAPALE